MTRSKDCIMANDVEEWCWEFKDEKNKPLYRLHPYGKNALCFRVDEYRKVKNRETGKFDYKWIPLECYPSTLDHACDIIRKMLMMKGVNDTRDLTEMKKALTKSTNQIVKAISEGKRGWCDA